MQILCNCFIVVLLFLKDKKLNNVTMKTDLDVFISMLNF